MSTRGDNPLKAAREAARRTQAQVAQAIGVEIATLRNWEQGRTEPNGRRLSLMADYLGTTVDHLLGREGGSKKDGVKAQIDLLTDEELEKVQDYIQLLLRSPRDRR